MAKRGVILEYIVGGGLMNVDSDSLSPSFRNEGWTMLSTIAQDWERCKTQDEPWEVIAPIDPRVPNWFKLPASNVYRTLDSSANFLDQWCRFAVDADAILLIAPESGGELTRLANAIDEVSDARLGCRSPFLERTSNKLMMADYIADEYLHPQTLTPAQFRMFVRSRTSTASRQWVMKPIDGAGCDGIWRGSTEALATFLDEQTTCPDSLIQDYLPGQAASVAAWVTDKGRLWLPPVWQDIQWESQTFASGNTLDHPSYLGGSGPIDSAHWSAIHNFGNRILDLLGPGALGWVGLDFVLNLNSGNPRCTIIEVNPRWTTSYAGLRQLYRGNLLERFLEISFSQNSDCG
jgi:predicted ATP-grasp superfamily ATP-dependent carboligase